MKKELYEFICPVYYLCYLVNDDADGIIDEEEQEIKTTLEGFTFLTHSEEEPYFRHNNDFNNLGGNVVTIFCEKVA